MDHSQHSNALLYGATAVASLSAAPYVLPSLGIGSKVIAHDAIMACVHGGTGIAGAMAAKIATLPYLGPILAAGTWSSALITSGLGLGGLLLGNYISKHYDGQTKLPWGKIIKYTALSTSLLIGLPSILSAITVGAAFLMSFVSIGAGGAFLGTSILGLAGEGGMASAGAGFAALLPHLLSCGLALLPAIGALLTTDHAISPKPTWTERVRPSEHVPTLAAAR